MRSVAEPDRAPDDIVGADIVGAAVVGAAVVSAAVVGRAAAVVAFGGVVFLVQGGRHLDP